MNTLRITISNEDGIVTGEYDMQCVARPGIDSDSAIAANLTCHAAARLQPGAKAGAGR